jgi:hypothetical protein
MLLFFRKREKVAGVMYMQEFFLLEMMMLAQISPG